MITENWYTEQEDPRTHINVKHVYVGCTTTLAVFAILFVSLRSSLLSKPCLVRAENPALWNGLNWTVLVLACLLLCLSIYFVIRWRYAWLTTKRTRTGEDVEDVDPYILAKSGSQLLLRTNDTYNHMMATFSNKPRY